ncbi:hypothetical protein BVI1335_1220059 [Burkholderia vietnamiensis]|nr:hypothetical protein BVI1335_1220059 [Burkholderia vietnamiensis]
MNDRSGRWPVTLVRCQPGSSRVHAASATATAIAAAMRAKRLKLERRRRGAGRASDILGLESDGMTPVAPHWGARLAVADCNAIPAPARFRNPCGRAGRGNMSQRRRGRRAAAGFAHLGTQAR